MSETLPVKGRHLLMIATGQSGDPEVWADLDVDAETSVWVEWLTDPALGDRAFTVAFDDLAHSPSKKRLNAMLDERGGFNKDRDAVVCYITGHGEQHNGEHRLILSTSVPGEPSTMLLTRQVLEWLMARVNTALVVVDTCYSGEVAAYLASLDEDPPDGWIVISTASAHQQARLGVLTKAVREFAATGAADPAFQELQFGELYKALSVALHGQRWKLLSTPPPFDDRPPCLPNRYYRPDVDERVVAEPARQDVAMYEKDLAAHWDPRSRGVAEASTSGVLFTGRDRLMGILVEAARGGPGAVVVTGAPGCGKSAVLSRLVTFSDPSFRARYADAVEAAEATGGPLPNVGDVDMAVLAKGLVAQGVLDAIRDRLEIDPIDGEPTPQTIARIHQRRAGLPPVTLVLDALDEAEDPRGIVNTVLAPLVSPPGGVAWLRLLVGVRGTASSSDAASGGGDALATATARALRANVVDAAAEFWSSADLAAYVARLLRVPLDGERPTPYADADDGLVDRLAATVAGIAGTSYVLARLISDQLRRQPHRQDPEDAAWQARARAGMASILDEELEADYPDPRRRARARALLTAASLGRGRGVPRRHIWPVLATTLHPRHERFADDDIAALLDDHVGGYLTRDVADDATVYRPFHDSLAEALTSPLDQAARHRVTTTLTDLFTVTPIHGLVVPPQEYLRRHLVEHAADSGDLDQLVHNPTVLTWSDPDHLVPLLGRLDDPEAREIGRIYRTTAHTLRQQGGPPDAFPLQLRARQAGLDPLADQLAGQLAVTAPHACGRLRWATPRRDDDHHRIDMTSVVDALTTATLPDGTPVIVSGSRDQTVRVWRLADGAPVGAPLRGHDSGVTSVAVGTLPDGTAVIVSGSHDQTVRVWLLADGAPVGAPLRGHDSGVTSVAVGTLPDGTPVIVSGSWDQTVRVWRLADGAPVGAPLRGHDHAVTSVAVGTLPDGTAVIVSGSHDRTVRVWRLADGTPVGPPPLRDDAVTSVAVGSLPDGTPVVVSGSLDGRVRVWRLADGTPVGPLPDGTPVVASGGWDQTVRVWRPADSARVGAPLRGHDGVVASVAVGALPDGTPVVVSGGWDQTVRVWRLADGAPVGAPLRGHDSGVNSVAVGALPDGTPVIVSGGWDETVRVWRPADSAPVAPLRGHDSGVTSLAVGALPDGTPVIVSGSWDETVRVWRLADGAPVGPQLRHDHAVTSVAVGALPDGTPVIVSGGWDQTVRVWRLADGTPVGLRGTLRAPRLRIGRRRAVGGHDSAVTSLAVGALPDGTPVVVSGIQDETVRVWRLADGAPVGLWGALRALRLRIGRRRVMGVRDNAVTSLPDGTPVVVSGCGDGTVLVWRLADGAVVGPPLRGHDHAVTSVAVGTLPDGTPVIVSGSQDETVRVWRLADGAPVGAPLRGHDSGVTSVAVGTLPDGTAVVVSGSWDRTVRVWRLADGAPIGTPMSVMSTVGAVAATGSRTLVAVGRDLFAMDLRPASDSTAAL